MNSKTSQSTQTNLLQRARASTHAPITLILLCLLGVTLLSSGCYERVVKDRSGTHIGDVYEGNLPDDTRGFWVDTFEEEAVEVTPSEANRIRRESQRIYNEQLEDMELKYKSRDD